MKFMFNYQYGYMYMRYLMWNFAGRQNDIQGYNGHRDGNWITGIKFLDKIRLGSQNNLTSDMLNNKARNTYYMLPFILGLRSEERRVGIECICCFLVYQL